MYQLTLINPDGTFVAHLETPVVPRFMHVHDLDDSRQAVELSDQPEPGDTVEHVTSFARVASAVWVDDDKAALYVRVVVAP